MMKTRAAIALAALSLEDARRVYVANVTARRVDYNSLLDMGWEETDADPGASISNDGREIVWSRGRALALKHEVRKRLVAEAASMAQAKAKPKERPGESLTSVLCPACQAVMAKNTICPNCSKGRAGFKILCVCTDCGHEVYL